MFQDDTYVRITTTQQIIKHSKFEMEACRHEGQRKTWASSDILINYFSNYSLLSPNGKCTKSWDISLSLNHLIMSNDFTKAFAIICRISRVMANSDVYPKC